MTRRRLQTSSLAWWKVAPSASTWAMGAPWKQPKSHGMRGRCPRSPQVHARRAVAITNRTEHMFSNKAARTSPRRHNSWSRASRDMISLGGMVAQQIALERPSIFRRMMLVGTAPRGGEDIMHLDKPRLAEGISPACVRSDISGQQHRVFISWREGPEARGAMPARRGGRTARAAADRADQS